MLRSRKLYVAILQIVVAEMTGGEFFENLEVANCDIKFKFVFGHVPNDRLAQASRPVSTCYLTYYKLTS